MRGGYVRQVPDKPAAEVVIDEALVRRLLESQAPDLADLPLRLVAEGWDNAVWRLGDDRAVRLPRRTLAAPLVTHEHLALPAIARRLEPTGIRVPAPLVAGRPDAGYPWTWSIVPWFDGRPGLEVHRPERAGWAESLASAVAALHATAEPGYPVNPVRGVPLVERAAAVAERFARLRRRRDLDAELVRAAERAWDEASTAPPWSGPPLWLHGDLHPGNLVAEGSRLVAIVDFGDVTAGDPAYDLGVAWVAFDEAGRSRFTEALDGRYDIETWVRARGWAAAVTAMLLDASDDNPPYAALGREALEEFAG